MDLCQLCHTFCWAVRYYVIKMWNKTSWATRLYLWLYSRYLLGEVISCHSSYCTNTRTDRRPFTSSAPLPVAAWDLPVGLIKSEWIVTQNWFIIQSHRAVLLRPTAAVRADKSQTHSYEICFPHYQCHCYAIFSLFPKQTATAVYPCSTTAMLHFPFICETYNFSLNSKSFL